MLRETKFSARGPLTSVREYSWVCPKRYGLLAHAQQASSTELHPRPLLCSLWGLEWPVWSKLLSNPLTGDCSVTPAGVSGTSWILGLWPVRPRSSRSPFYPRPPHSVIIPTNIFLKEKEVCMIFQLPQLTWFKNAEICFLMILRSKCHGLCLFPPQLLGGREDPVGLFWPQTVQAHSPPLPQVIPTLKVLPRLAFSTVLLLWPSSVGIITVCHHTQLKYFPFGHAGVNPRPCIYWLGKPLSWSYIQSLLFHLL